MKPISRSAEYIFQPVQLCESAAVGHYKNAHQTRNRAMVDRSDLVVFCIQRGSGGAWRTLKYVKKQGKSYINLHDQRESGI